MRCVVKLTKMQDGYTYYNNQSEGRGIRSVIDVERLATQEQVCFDRLLLPFLPKNKSEAIYEAATGPGILQHWLHSRGYTNLEGSDFSANEADMAVKINPNVICEDSINDLEQRFQPGSLSAIIALDFYEHIPRERFREFLSIAATRLKTGGIMILRGPNADSPFAGLNLYNDITHVWAYTTDCSKILMRLAGFKKVEFADDTITHIHVGRWWKLPLMVATQLVLTFIVHAATRKRITLWGSSIYVFAQK